MTYRPGDELPAFVLPITPGVVVAGAIATRDFQPVHHDRDFAVAAGSKDIFMNILTTNGYVQRYVTDHFGPSCRIKAVRIRLGVPNYPGDTMTMSGRIEAIGEDGTVVVAVKGANSMGDHVTASVELRP